LCGTFSCGPFDGPDSEGVNASRNLTALPKKVFIAFLCNFLAMCLQLAFREALIDMMGHAGSCRQSQNFLHLTFGTIFKGEARERETDLYLVVSILILFCAL